MQKKRWWRKLGLLRKFLSFAICVISLVALLSAHIHIFPHSQVPAFFEYYKLPNVSLSLLQFFNFSVYIQSLICKNLFFYSS